MSPGSGNGESFLKNYQVVHAALFIASRSAEIPRLLMSPLIQCHNVCGLAELGGILKPVVRNAGARRTAHRVHHHDSRLEIGVVDGRHSHVGGAGAELQRILLRLDSPRARRNRGLLLHSVRARTVEPAKGASLVTVRQSSRRGLPQGRFAKMGRAFGTPMLPSPVTGRCPRLLLVAFLAQRFAPL
jgi:hypothetical protein